MIKHQTLTVAIQKLNTAMIQQHPKFALEMSQFMDERKKLIRSAEGIESASINVNLLNRFTRIIS